MDIGIDVKVAQAQARVQVAQAVLHTVEVVTVVAVTAVDTVIVVEADHAIFHQAEVVIEEIGGMVDVEMDADTTDVDTLMDVETHADTDADTDIEDVVIQDMALGHFV